MLDIAFEWGKHSDWKFSSLEEAVLKQTGDVDIFALKEHIDNVRRELPPPMRVRASVVDTVFEAHAARFTSFAALRQVLGA